jgi:hypothetical protein
LGYGAQGARLGGEKRSGGGRHSHLGVGGCGEAASCPCYGKRLRWSPVLDEDGAPVILRSKHGAGKIQGARAVLHSLVEGLAMKIAAALVLEKGATRMGFDRGNNLDVLRKDTC